ncbi:hydroxyisourate hydrolase [Metabacillus fastidiosus]|uniref:hydroxyisourate hydrolase n=1 Tax=Metabacillus fastidiosus TaxID=1458 RepID=UPI003D291DE0
MSLTTHVLDLSKGLPAKEVKIDLWRLNSDNRELLKTVHTNSDGRVDSPLLTREETEVGQYELVFYVGGYLANGGKTEENAFLNEVPIRFGISNPESHYHIPLLVAPGGYSTYRGS